MKLTELLKQIGFEKIENKSTTLTDSDTDYPTTNAVKTLDSATWNDYEIQKNGTDGTGIINFKTE